MSIKWYGEEIERKIVEATLKGLTKGALAVQGQAKLLCPVGETGHLRDSIIYKVAKDEATIGTNVEYAPYVEYGTGIYAIGGRGRKTPWVYYDESKNKFYWTRGNRPRSFLRRGFDEQKETVINLFKKEILRALK